MGVGESFVEVPSVGLYEEAHKDFDEIVESWLPQLSKVNRFAFSGVILSKAASKNEGYKMLGRFLPSLHVPSGDDASDFSFTINRPRNSKVIKARVNRLTTWRLIQQIVVMVQGDQPIQSMPPPVTETQFVTLEFDINSSPEYGKIIQEAEIKGLYREFSEMVSEIQAKGDVA
jgi:hypothetical protein